MRRALPVGLALVALGQPIGLCLAVSTSHALEHVLELLALERPDLEAAAEHGHSHSEPTLDHTHVAYPPSSYAATAPVAGSAAVEGAANAELPKLARSSPSHGTGCDPPPRRPPLVLRV